MDDYIQIISFKHLALLLNINAMYLIILFIVNRYLFNENENENENEMQNYLLIISLLNIKNWLFFLLLFINKIITLLQSQTKYNFSFLMYVEYFHCMLFLVFLFVFMLGCFSVCLCVFPM